jgi:molybdopterin/thiamine biosynthesis adenylyltransferase
LAGRFAVADSRRGHRFPIVSAGAIGFFGVFRVLVVRL